LETRIDLFNFCYSGEEESLKRRKSLERRKRRKSLMRRKNLMTYEKEEPYE